MNEEKRKKDSNPDKILRRARKLAREGATYWSENWKEAEADLRFLAGEQWPEGVRTQRELEQRPCLVNNVLPTFVDQVIGDQRQNRPSIKVSATNALLVPTAEKPEGEELKIPNITGSKQYKLGEVLTGIIKNIEYNCDAETAYDIAFQSAVESGMGFLRVRTDYLSDDTFEQDLIIEAIENQFSVTIDPNAKKRDKSDMNWCLIDDTMDKEQFEKLYPNASTDPAGSEQQDDMGVWYSDNTVKISEYFTREPVTKTMALLSDGRQAYLDEIKPVLDELEQQGITVQRTRKVKTYKVFWRKITGMDILEGPIEIPCSTIPVVPVWGKALVIKKKVMFRSIIRHSKDAQRMANYWDSAATEAVALAPKAPFIASEGQVEGKEREWENSNTSNIALLTYVPQYAGDPGPRREQTAAVPAAELTLGMKSTDKIKSTLGMFDASVGAQGNETSGKAIVARQRQGDRGSFAFIDNLSKSITRIGRICVEMIPRVYDTERIVRMKLSDESEDFVKLNEQVLDEQTNKWITIHDLSVAKYDVAVATGPSYSTQRIEAAESMVQFAQAVPSAAAVMADLIAQNMDWPGADVIAERLKKIIPANVLSKTEQEDIAKDQPEQQPTPEQQLQAQEMQTRTAESQADIAKAKATEEKAKADVVIAQLKTQEAQAKLQEINEKADGGNVAYQQIKEMVAQALAEVIHSQANSTSIAQ